MHILVMKVTGVICYFLFALKDLAIAFDHGVFRHEKLGIMLKKKKSWAFYK